MNEKRDWGNLIRILTWVVAAVLLTCFVVAYVISPNTQTLVVCVAATIIVVCATVFVTIYVTNSQRNSNAIFDENAEISSKIMYSMQTPCFLCKKSGTITWQNEAFTNITSQTNAKTILGVEELLATNAMTVTISGRTYKASIIAAKRQHSSDMFFVHFTDETEKLHFEKLYRDTLPTVAMITIDNLDDQTLTDGLDSTYIAKIRNFVVNMAEQINGTYSIYETGKFRLEFEAKFLSELENARFPILELARTVILPSDMCLTLSIGVGMGESIRDATDNAEYAYKLARDRGGDQAVVKRYDGREMIFGGTRILEMPKSRVLARLMAMYLKRFIETADDIYVMGHIAPDMDCIGAAIGILQCAALLGKPAYYVIKGGRQAVRKEIFDTVPIPDYINIIDDNDERIEQFNPNVSKLIIVDAHSVAQVTSKVLYEAAKGEHVIMRSDNISVSSKELANLATENGDLDRLARMPEGAIYVDPSEPEKPLPKQTVVDASATVETLTTAKRANIFVIDHHRKNANKNLVCDSDFAYMESRASSASEMITEIIRFLPNSGSNMRFAATALLAGICLDTKSFAFNTGIRTFEAAAYLRRCGADTVAVKIMFQNERESVKTKFAAIQEATFMTNIGIALAVNPTNDMVTGSQIADELINIRDMRASIVLTAGVGRDGKNVVKISARSLGTINVEMICAHWNGGGHMNMAAAIISGRTIDEARDEVEEYLRETFSGKAPTA